MQKTRRIALFATLMLLAPIFPGQAAAPLRYHTYLVAVIEARVNDIRLTDIPSLGTPEPSRERSPRSGDAQVQKISLKITKVVNIELNRTGALMRPGDSLEVTNQFLKQQPPFTPGQTIRARVRLVLPEERYEPQDPRQQWWFFPTGEPAGILPPRHPFTGIEVVR